MADRNDERYRRNQPVRGFDDRDGGWGDSRAHGRDERQQEEWQPESSTSGDWDSYRLEEHRRRERLSPGQLSEGGPGRDDAGYSSRYGQRRYPDHPSYRGEMGDSWAEQRRAEGYAGRYADRNESERGWERGGSTRGSQGVGGWAGSTRSDGDRGYGSEGRYGSPSRFGQQGQYRGDEMGGAGDWGRNRRSGSAGGSDAYRGRTGATGREGGQDWVGSEGWDRRHERSNERSSYPQGYFNELRGDRAGSAQPYRSAARSQPATRQWGDEGRWSGDDARQGWERRDYREYPGSAPHGLHGHGDEFEQEGTLYRIGRRIGEVVGEWFGDDDNEGPRRTGPKGYQRSDERIREIVCERLAYTDGVNVDEVSVDVKSGVVTLTGSVRRRSEKYDIEDVADSVYGVSEVENNIRVRREGEVGRDAGTGSYAASIGAELGITREPAGSGGVGSTGVSTSSATSSAAGATGNVGGTAAGGTHGIGSSNAGSRSGGASGMGTGSTSNPSTSQVRKP